MISSETLLSSEKTESVPLYCKSRYRLLQALINNGEKEFNFRVLFDRAFIKLLLTNVHNYYRMYFEKSSILWSYVAHFPALALKIFQNPSIFRTRSISKTLVYSEPEAYSEHFQTSTMERFAKIAT